VQRWITALKKTIKQKKQQPMDVADYFTLPSRKLILLGDPVHDGLLLLIAAYIILVFDGLLSVVLCENRDRPVTPQSNWYDRAVANICKLSSAVDRVVCAFMLSVALYTFCVLVLLPSMVLLIKLMLTNARGILALSRGACCQNVLEKIFEGTRDAFDQLMRAPLLRAITYCLLPLRDYPWIALMESMVWHWISVASDLLLMTCDECTPESRALSQILW
jgi:hypothetical protein